MENYQFTVVSTTRILRGTIRGSLSKPIAEDYIRDFRRAAEPLLGKPWVLLSDLNRWRMFPQDTVSLLVQCLLWARGNGMAYNANILTDTIHRIQLKRIFEKEGILEVAQIFADEANALVWLKAKGF